MKFEIKLTDPLDAQRRIEVGFAHQDITVEGEKFKGKGFAGRYAIYGNVLHVTITEKPPGVLERWIKKKIKGYLA